MEYADQDQMSPGSHLDDFGRDSSGRRFTTVHDRYQICDSCCGQVETATSLKKASAIAEAHAKKHGNEADNTVTVVEVYDRMARRNCQDTWQFNVTNAKSGVA